MSTSNTILMPTDFSDSATKTFAWAAKFIVQNGDKVVLLHTLEELHADDNLATSANQQLYQGAERKLNEWADQLRLQLGGKTATIETKVSFGSAGVAVCQKAEKIKADLVVVGMHGQTDQKSLVLGPVATYLSEYLTQCPLFIVKDKAVDV
ncbi:hypothetical protein BATDEDRAFT_22754 [Batrachochytrium dendrobatidis JAM81]|uniref:UspA domain-containing protein n=2 Tax=Batrachochytrium dendrobatidis TaxID=109871 RepID=F4NXG7_BATDJ|nr:uncharacterized protein BATDEDRAFT_22754 [Batrachochytrium dendrobatidis JAM81]EGF82347.1 hypothetical protein BATDEDRAFT_22754 [Batrachochytrium dendrobatidis JAM81]KAJ8328368.1 hypothetical protein O5D80_003726 [Batrachochytrium dendrobatidis]KAK5673428.1 hypothetical protein QVD99_000875 [Batrachochytrium dendrobatidis]OAJ39893.1 hypothetical protein BDEG_23691 [Batrachochytrium dendrobatidis JEL423]|eukprot:XP_006676613.1 hypothetical protein BATDEDRAFT_22754 [Batrachochytrium dendrobatidis JAM81]